MEVKKCQKQNSRCQFIETKVSWLFFNFEGRDNNRSYTTGWSSKLDWNTINLSSQVKRSLLTMKKVVSWRKHELRLFIQSCAKMIFNSWYKESNISKLVKLATNFFSTSIHLSKQKAVIPKSVNLISWIQENNLLLSSDA